MGDHVFPPRLTMAQALAAQNAEQMGDLKRAKLLSCHPKVSSKFGSNLDCQRALTGSPGPIIGYFNKLKKVLKEYNFLPENIYNMDEKGFMLGMSGRSKCLQSRKASSTSNARWNA